MDIFANVPAYCFLVSSFFFGSPGSYPKLSGGFLCATSEIGVRLTMSSNASLLAGVWVSQGSRRVGGREREGGRDEQNRRNVTWLNAITSQHLMERPSSRFLSRGAGCAAVSDLLREPSPNFYAKGFCEVLNFLVSGRERVRSALCPEEVLLSGSVIYERHGCGSARGRTQLVCVPRTKKNPSFRTRYTPAIRPAVFFCFASCEGLLCSLGQKIALPSRCSPDFTP